MVKQIATRIGAIILSLMMVVCMTPSLDLIATGYADDGDTPATTAVASIGDTQYDSLDAALEAAQAGATIKLEADTESASYLEIKKTVTFDLNGYTLSRTSGNALLNPIGSGVTLTVKDSRGSGKLESGIPIWVEGGAAFVLESGTINSTDGFAAVRGDNASAITINDGTITGGEYAMNIDGATAVVVNDGTISTSGGNSFTIALLGNNGSLTVNGGTIKATGADSVAVSDNGTNSKTDITINGGNISSAQDIAIYKPAAGKLTLNGGTITGGTGIYVKSGELVIPAASTVAVTGNGAKVDYSHSGNGAVSTGDAIIIENCNYPGGAPTASIEGGSFTSANSNAVSSVAYDDPASDTSETAITGFISGGTFTTDVSENYLAPGVTQAADGSVDVGELEVTLSATKATYDGTNHKPTLTKVMLGDKDVTADAELTWESDEAEFIDAGTYNGTVKYGAASKAVKFQIGRMKVSDLEVDVADQVYTGSAITPDASAFTFKDEYGDPVSGVTFDVTATSNNTNVGHASISIAATGNYIGSINGTFDIKPADLKDVDVTLSPSSYFFGDADKYEPEVTAKLGDYELVKDTDYTVTYSNNDKVGTAKVTLTPAGDNFTGEPKEKTFKINAAVAKVDGTKYTTLSAAIKAVNGTKGKTVELLQDQNLSGIFNRFTINEGTEYTLDLGGHTLMMNGAYFTLNGGKLIVTNGTIETKGNMSQEFTVNSGELNVTESATIKGSGTVSPIGVFGPATINTAGKLIAANSFAIAGNGSEGKGGYTINITGGEVTSTGAPAVYHPNEGTVNISGGIITGTSAVYQKSGELNITGGTLKATGEKTEYSFNGNGANATGDAVVIDNCGYPGGAPVPIISGGTFESANAEAVASYAYTAEGAAEENEPVEGFVSGGSFNTEIPESYAAEGMIPAVLDEDTGTYTVVEGAKITVEDIAALTFNGFEQKPVLVVKCGTDTLTEDDYSVEYAPKTGDANAQVGANGLPVNAGTYTATIKGLGEYKTAESDTVTKEVTVNAADINDADVKLTPESFIFENGGSFEPIVEVTIGEVPTQYVLKANTDYTLTYKDNDKAGTAKAVVTPVSGGNFKGEAKESPYTISSAVAKIGDTHYATLEAAIEAAKAGDTITIEADIEVASYVEIHKSLTIDLAGNTISRNGSALLNPMGSGVTLTVKDSVGGGKVTSKIPVWVEDGAGFVLESGTIEAKDDNIAVYALGTDITINGGTVTGGRYGVYGESGSAIEINDGTVTGKYNAIYAEHATEVTVNGGKVSTSEKSTFTISLWGNNGSLTVNGGTIEATGDDSVAISDNGNNAKSDITINGGTITSAKDIAIYKPAAGTLTVKGGTITGGTGIYVKSGDLVIPADSTAKITGNGEAKDFAHSGNGALSTGDAVVIENCSYPGGAPKADIKGGTFESENAQAAASYAWTEDGAAEENEPVEQFITGGTFKSPAAGSEAAITAAAAEGMVAVPVADDTYGIGTLDVTVDSDANTAVVKAKIGSEEYTAANITTTKLDIDNIKDLKALVEGMLEDGMTFGSTVNIAVSAVEKSYKAGEDVFEIALVATANDDDATKATIANDALADSAEFNIDLNLKNMGAKSGQYVNVKHESEGYDTTNTTALVNSSVKITAKVNHFSTLTVTPVEAEDATVSITKDGVTYYYDTLKNAITASEDGDTIVLLQDSSKADFISYTKKAITIDLNGHSYTRSTNGAAVQVGANGGLTIKDSVGGGSFNSDSNIGIEVKAKTAVINVESGKVTGGTWGISGSNGTVNVSGGSVEGATIGVRTTSGKVNVSGGTVTGAEQGILDYGNSAPAEITITGGTITCTGTGSDTGAILLSDASTLSISEADNPVTITGGHSGIAVFDAAKVTVNGGKITGNAFGITGNGSEGMGGYTFDIKGGTVSGDIGIYHPNDGTVNVSGGTVTGDTAIYQKSGTLSITGGNIKATGDKAEYSHNANGANPTGDAVVVENCSYPGGAPEASITGGIFESENANTIGSYAWTEEGAAEENEPLENFVTGGAFVGDDIDKATLPEGKGLKFNEEDGYYHIDDVFIVTFDADNAEGDSDITTVEVFKNDKVTKPEDPARDHGYFLGWYKGSDAYDFDTKVTENISLKAKWMTVPASAEIYINDQAEIEVDNLTVPEGGSFKWVYAPGTVLGNSGWDKTTGTATTYGKTPGSGTVTLQIRDSEDAVIGEIATNVTVKDVSAVVDGTEYDTAHFQDAVDAAIESGKVLGVYPTKQAVTLTEGQTLKVKAADNRGKGSVTVTAQAATAEHMYVIEKTTADGITTYTCVDKGTPNWEVTDANDNVTYAETIKAAKGATYKALKDFESEQINITKTDITIDLNGHTITFATGDGDAAIITGVMLPAVEFTIKDSSEAGTGKIVNDGIAVWASKGKSKVIIEGGEFVSGGVAVYTSEGSTAEINGGTFKATGDEKNFLINCQDAHTGTITVNYGTFYDFDPNNNTADGENTDYVPDGKIVVEGKDGTSNTYTVYDAVTVTFDADNADDDSDVTTVTIPKGEKVEKPADPTKENNDFVGWTLDGEAYDFDTAVTKDITLKAAWDQIFAKKGDEKYYSAEDAIAAFEEEAVLEILSDEMSDITVPEINGTVKNGTLQTIKVNGVDVAPGESYNPAKAKIEADIEDLKDIVEDLQDQIDDLQDQIDALDDTYATDEDVADKIAAAKEAIETAQAAVDAAQDVELEENVEALEKAIEDAVAALEAADEATLEAAKAYTDEVAADLQDKIDDLQDQIDALDDTYATDDQVAAAIEAAKAAIEEAQKAIDDAQDKALEDSVADLTAAIQAAKDAAEAADAEVLAAAKAYTDEAVADLQSQIDDLNDKADSLQDQIDKLDDTYATDADVADKIAAAREAIETAQAAVDAAQDAALADSVADLTAAIQEAKDAAAAADEEVLEAAKAYTDQVAGQLQDQIDGLQDQLDKLDDTFATDQDVADKIAAAREAIEAAQKAKDDLQDAKIEELEDAILNIVIDVQEAQKAVDEAQDAKIAALEGRLTGAETQIGDLESQIAALKAEITQNNLNSISVSLKATVSDYKTIKLSWNTTKITLDGKAVTYEIYCKKGSSKTWKKLLTRDCKGDGKRMTYTFKNLDTGTKYQFYAVPTTVFNGEQYVGSESTVVSAKPLPSRVVTTGITAGKQKFTIKFKKVKGATGYQIGYRDWTKVKENFKLVKGSTSVISKTITKLVSKHKYTARVRAYRLVNGKKVYGKWSKIRRVQVK